MNKNDSLPVFPAAAYADPIPSIYAPHAAYINGIMPLMLRHAWQQIRDGQLQPEQALSHNAWIIRLITLDTRVLHTVKQNEIPGWIQLRERLLEQLAVFNAESDVPNRINACEQLLQPFLAARFIDQYRFPRRKFQCWWWTIHDDNTHLALHLVNAYQPDSPFQHLRHFATTMLQAIEDGRKQYPWVSVISCGSWLNQNAKFRALWPESFNKNQKILNETGGFGPGAWGQYMTTDGGFNVGKASQLLRTGKHPFPLTEGRTTINEALDHLSKFISSLS
jgi:hypothetical protein